MPSVWEQGRKLYEQQTSTWEQGKALYKQGGGKEPKPAWEDLPYGEPDVSAVAVAEPSDKDEELLREMTGPISERGRKYTDEAMELIGRVGTAPEKIYPPQMSAVSGRRPYMMGEPGASMFAQVNAYAKYLARRMAMPLAKPIIGIAGKIMGGPLADIKPDVIPEAELQRELDRPGWESAMLAGGEELVAGIGAQEHGLAFRVAGDAAEIIGAYPYIHGLMTGFGPTAFKGASAAQVAAETGGVAGPFSVPAGRWGQLALDESALFATAVFASEIAEGKSKEDALIAGIQSGAGYFTLNAIGRGVGKALGKGKQVAIARRNEKLALKKLGLKRGATPEQIKAAHRNLVKGLHPDNIKTGDPAAFKEVQQAYEFLSQKMAAPPVGRVRPAAKVEPKALARIAPPAEPPAPRKPPAVKKWERATKQRAGRRRNELEKQIVQQWHQESGLTEEELAEKPEHVGEQYGADPTWSFPGKIPGEILDHFPNRRLPRGWSSLIRGDVPGATGQDYLAQIGSEAFLAEIERAMTTKAAMIQRSVEQARAWAKQTGNYELYSKIAEYEALASAKGDTSDAAQAALSGFSNVKASDLQKGDSFTINGERFEVTQRTAESVEVTDGIEGEIRTDEDIRIDQGSLKIAPPAPELPKPPTEQEPPRVVGETPPWLPAGPPPAAPPAGPAPKTDLFGKEIIEPISGTTADLGIGEGEVFEQAVGEVEIKPELAQEVARQITADPSEMNSPEDVYLAIQAEHKMDAARFFNKPNAPMPEVEEAWARATKGGALFQADPTAPTAYAAKKGGFLALPGKGKPKTGAPTPWLDMDKAASPDKQVQSFFGRTNRMVKPSAKLREAAKKVRLWFRERFVFAPKVPSIPEAALARDMIRTMPEQREAAMGQAIEDVQKILDGEGDRQVIDVAGLEVFRKKVFVDDLLSDVAKDRPLPRGLSKENLEAERDRLDGVIEKVPSVKDALTLRQQLWERVSQDLAERGVISEEAAKNPTYIRHFVLDFIDEIRPAPGRTQRFKAPYRAYAKPRKGTLRDISTDYLEVELKALSTIYRDNAVQDMAERIAENYGVVKHEGEVPEGYVEWQFKRGNIVYRAQTITDAHIAKILEATLTDPEVAKGLQIPLNSLREGLVLGGKRKTYIIPDWLALQLDDLPVTHKPGAAASLGTPFTQTWKRWILRVNPIRYNKRNAIGDGERLNAAGRTKAFLLVPQATKMLATHSSPDAHPEAYRKAVEYGAIRSSLWHEMGKARNRREFERFYRVKNLGAWKRAVRTAAWPGKIVSRTGQSVQDATQFREDILRAAVYLQALDDVDAFITTGKPIRHWVGAEKDIASLAKADKYRAAAKISRETLGDYGNFTPWENDKLRNGLMPFYSWLKINTTFWPKTVAGAAKEGVGAGEVLGPRLVRGAWNVGKWIPRAFGLYALMVAWNNRDEEARKREASLPAWIHGRSHITLEDGVIYEPTALSDFTEWLGLDDDIADIRRWDRNQISGSELALSVMKNKAKASVNKVVQAINPFLKTPATLMGMRTFPDVFDAKPFAQAFSTKAQERAVLEVLGADVQRFVDAGKGRRTLNEALAYYFSGSAYRAMSPDSLSERLRESLSRRTYKKTTIDRKTGAVRVMGAPHKGKKRDVDILRNRLRALEE